MGVRGCLPFADHQCTCHYTLLTFFLFLCVQSDMVNCWLGIEGWIPVRRFQAWQTLLPPPTSSSTCPSKVPTSYPPQCQMPLPPPAAPVKLTSTTEEMAAQLHSSLHTSSAIPPKLPVKETIGKCLGLMRPQSKFVGSHAAIPLLQQYTMNGCPVGCVPDWTREKNKLLLQRGLHQSARLPPAVKQLQEETKKKMCTRLCTRCTVGRYKT